MIYIRTKYDSLCEDTHIVAVYSVICKDVSLEYKKFMIDKAQKINLNINPHWLNAMDYENNNTHLSIDDYNIKLKQWEKILRTWNIGKFICDILKGVKLNYKIV